jgi:hypothetical protein
MRWFFLLLTALFTSHLFGPDTQAQSETPTNEIPVFIFNGTLIVYVPAKDGMVVAADSRARVGSENCDDTTKIVPLIKHPRSVVAVAGFDVIQTIPDGSDPCEYRKTHPPNIMFSELARDYLDSQNGEIDEKTLGNLEKEILNKLQIYNAERPVRGVRPGPLIAVTFGSYDPKNNVSTYGDFEVFTDGSNQFSVGERNWRRVNQADSIGFFPRGAVPCASLALSPEGKQLLGQEYLKERDYVLSHYKTVSQITNETALAFALDIIRSVERLGELKINAPYPCDVVGGPVRAVLLDKSHRAPVKLQ